MGVGGTKLCTKRTLKKITTKNDSLKFLLSPSQFLMDITQELYANGKEEATDIVDCLKLFFINNHECQCFRRPEFRSKPDKS